MKISPRLPLLAFVCMSFAGTSLAAIGDFTIGKNNDTTAGGNNWPGNEVPVLALDGSAGTKYLNFAKLYTGFIVTLGSSAAVNSISFNSANDAAERNPTTFSVYGSNSTTTNGAEAQGTVFNLSLFAPVVLDQTTGLTASTPFLTNSIQSFSNSTSYLTYLVVFPTVANAGSANSMQIGDAVLRAGGSPVVTGSSLANGGVLTPLPEPSSMLLLGAGLAYLAARRKRG